MSALRELQIRNAVGSGWLWGMVAGAVLVLMVVGVVQDWPAWPVSLLAVTSLVMQVFVWGWVENRAVDRAELVDRAEDFEEHRDG
jgi:hypothetical protein